MRDTTHSEGRSGSTEPGNRVMLTVAGERKPRDHGAAGAAERLTRRKAVPRRLLVLGAVEDPGTKLWHVADSSDETKCGADCVTWPRVAHAVERAGIWCGRCLIVVLKEA